MQNLISNFESYAKKTDNDVEFWLARDLQNMFGYSKWENFLKVIEKAKTACEKSNNEINDHFADVRKKVLPSSGHLINFFH